MATSKTFIGGQGSYKCKICKKIGHLAAVCKNKNAKLVNVIEETVEPVQMFTTNVQNVNYVNPFVINSQANGKSLQMELDTGAAVSCIPESIFKEVFAHNTILEPTEIELKTYNGEIFKPTGKVNVLLKIGNKELNCC